MSVFFRLFFSLNTRHHLRRYTRLALHSPKPATLPPRRHLQGGHSFIKNYICIGSRGRSKLINSLLRGAHPEGDIFSCSSTSANFSSWMSRSTSNAFSGQLTTMQPKVPGSTWPIRLISKSPELI